LPLRGKRASISNFKHQARDRSQDKEGFASQLHSDKRLANAKQEASIRQPKVLLLSMLAYIHKQAFLLSTFGA
jgi:hypothetical protein